MKKRGVIVIHLEQPERFKEYEKLFLRVSLSMLLLSVILAALGAYAVNSVQAVPAEIIYFSMLYLYAHAPYFVFSLARVVKFFVRIRPNFEGVTIGRSFLSVLLTPISAGIAYFAMFFLALSSCAA